MPGSIILLEWRRGNGLLAERRRTANLKGEPLANGDTRVAVELSDMFPQHEFIGESPGPLSCTLTGYGARIHDELAT